MNDLVNVDTAAILVGLGLQVLFLGAIMAWVLKSLMGDEPSPCCWKCGTSLSQREIEFLQGDDGRIWCNRCIANATAGGPA